MSIQSLAEHELRSLVRFGAPKFAALAQAELDRRAAARLPVEDPTNSGPWTGMEGAAVEAFPEGRWS